MSAETIFWAVIRGIVIGIVVAVVIRVNAMATPNDIVKCEYYAADVGHITGLGEDQYKAQGNAATVCFERRVELYKRLRQETPSEDRQLLFIDSCINIVCEDKNERQK